MNICFQKNGFREIVYNSLQHKLFTSGVPIQISVYDDKIYVWNDGQLPKTITKENIFEKHASKPSNPKIAQTFFKAGFVEAWGRGFEKIKEECKKNGNPMPEVTENTGGVMVKCIPSENYLNLLFKMKFSSIAQENSEFANNLTKLQIDILYKIKENSHITQTQLANELKVSRQSIAMNIKDLREKNVLKRIGTNRIGYWQINS